MASCDIRGSRIIATVNPIKLHAEHATHTPAPFGPAAVVVMLGTAAWLVGSLADLHDRFSRQSRELGIAFLIVLILFLAFATFSIGDRCCGIHG